MDCKKCRIELEAYLCDVPSKWREQIINVLCNYLENQEFPCIDILTCINDEMGTLDPKCLAPSQAAWEALSWTDKMQLIINKLCDIIGLGQLFIEDTNTVDLEGDGTNGNPLMAYIKISATPGNSITENADGIYAPEFALVTTEDTESIDITGDGSLLDPIKADLLISADADNSAEIRSDGLYVPEITNLCASVNSTFTTDHNQYNNTNQNSYNFLSNGGDCGLISPPTGFAVSGTTRTSAFGSMEWYATLTLANAAAVSGETVLIFNTTVEDLTCKTGVSYFGIGNKFIGALTASSTNCSITNLTITGDVTVNGTSVIYAYNTTVLGETTITSTARWEGGRFMDNSTRLIITGSAGVNNIYSEKRVNITQSGRLSNFNITYLAADNNSALDVNVSTSAKAIISNGLVFAPNLLNTNPGATYVIANQTDSEINITNVTSETSATHAIYLQCGGQSENGSLIASNLTGKSVSKDGIRVVGNQLLGATVNLTSVVINNCVGYSNSGHGITTINGNLKKCTGYSITGAGIFVGGSDNDSFNLNIIDCIGEAKSYYGLLISRDVYIIGGTYISRLNTTAGNPIRIDTNAAFVDPTGARNYFISGVRTVSTNITAYAISGVANLILRADSNSFLNQYLATNVPGIDPIITLRTVNYDGNPNNGNRK